MQILVMLSVVVFTCQGAIVSTGKTANQSLTKSGQVAGKALDRSNWENGNIGAYSQPATTAELISWWEVDLGQEFDVDYITVTTTTYSNWHEMMHSARLWVFDSSRESSDVYPPISGVESGKVYTYCYMPMYVRYVRLERKGQLVVGLVEVHTDETIIDEMDGPEDTDTGCSKIVYERIDNNRVADPMTMTGAQSAAHCGIFCQQVDDCVSFSYTVNDPSHANCRLSDNHNSTLDSDSVFNFLSCNN